MHVSAHKKYRRKSKILLLGEKLLEACTVYQYFGCAELMIKAQMSLVTVPVTSQKCKSGASTAGSADGQAACIHFKQLRLLSANTLDNRPDCRHNHMLGLWHFRSKRGAANYAPS